MLKQISPLPWYAMNDESPSDIRDETGNPVALVHVKGHLCEETGKANGKRIVDCVNACAGFTYPSIDVARMAKALRKAQELLRDLESPAHLCEGGALDVEIESIFAFFNEEA